MNPGRALAAAALLSAACASAPRPGPAGGERSDTFGYALEVRVSSWGPTGATLDLPRAYSNEDQTLLEEWIELSGLRSQELPDPERRVLRVFAPDPPGEGEPTRLRYAARIRRHPRRDGASAPPVLQTWPEAEEALRRFLQPTSELPARSPRVRKFLISRVEPRLEAGATDVVREILAVVVESIEVDRGRAKGPGVLEALRTGVTTPIGLHRLLVTCLRTAEIPARLAAGLDLRAPAGERFLRWTEVWLEGRWWPLLPPAGGDLPRHLIELDHGDRRFLPRSRETELRFSLVGLPAGPGPSLGEAAARDLDARAKTRRGPREKRPEEPRP